MKNLNRIFVRVLITVLPILITIYLFSWCILLFDNLLGGVIRAVIPTEYYVPGFGVVAAIVLIFVFGLLLNHYVTARILASGLEKLTQVPFIKVIYSPLRDLMNLFSDKDKRQMKSVVLVPMGGVQMLGVVTRESFSDLPADLASLDSVAVYIPFSYGMGGFTVIVSKDQIKHVDISIEKAMSLAITGWVKSDPATSKRPGE